MAYEILMTTLDGLTSKLHGRPSYSLLNERERGRLEAQLHERALHRELAQLAPEFASEPKVAQHMMC